MNFRNLYDQSRHLIDTSPYPYLSGMCIELKDLKEYKQIHNEIAICECCYQKYELYKFAVELEVDTQPGSVWYCDVRNCFNFETYRIKLVSMTDIEYLNIMDRRT